MRKNILLGSILTTALFIEGCAHHRDVRPGNDGVNRVVLKSETKDGAYRDAMSEAEDYCKELQKHPMVVSEKSDYTGTMDESTYNAAKTASKVAKAVGGAGMAFGGRNEKTAGGVAAVGGGIANDALGQGYTYELVFKCQ